ncbi:hypothetical protein [Microbulbifer sp. TYP-18]|uniref:hypothetical protein n=1 Tax=Microbulbifer sp. TYP-18 TaxID=3230024 RepID=UPI0034C6CF59
MPTKEQEAAFRDAWKQVLQDPADGKRLPELPAHPCNWLFLMRMWVIGAELLLG